MRDTFGEEEGFHISEGKKNPYRFTSLPVCATACLFVETLFLRDTWRYQVEINIKYLPLGSLEAIKNQATELTECHGWFTFTFVAHAQSSLPSASGRWIDLASFFISSGYISEANERHKTECRERWRTKAVGLTRTLPRLFNHGLSKSGRLSPPPAQQNLLRHVLIKAVSMR
ncbi:hypothetical protein EVAR_4107_1 [Eumeta japonica]|uniref:Uncharacterized protein n=1 Tax=Eumeta variegata TaxID=151549 RepID=A0A4C1T745_EUMVA|nr:hypothetical protein EVAR_4107_1 [Eumeta japonica]